MKHHDVCAPIDSGQARRWTPRPTWWRIALLIPSPSEDYAGWFVHDPLVSALDPPSRSVAATCSGQRGVDPAVASDDRQGFRGPSAMAAR